MTDSLTKHSEKKMNDSENPQNLSNNSVLNPKSLKAAPKTIAKPQKDCFFSAFSDSDSNDGSDRSPHMNLQKFLEMPDLGNDYLELGPSGSKDSGEKQTDLTFDALPPANPLITEKYSLDADMIFGWKPKSVSKAPIPLKFSSSMVEEIIERFVEEENEDSLTGFPELVYQGFRPDNSFFAHEKFSSPETYTFRLSHLLSTRHTYLMKHMYNENPERPFVGMNKDVGEGCLTFNSIFEGGNLDTVIRTGYDAYDLFIRTDSNTKGHTNWYYFKVGNMKKGQTVTFNIVNFSRSSSLYQQGMKPYIYSEKQFQEKKIGWSQQGENIIYRKSFIGYHGQTFTEPNQKKYFRLSFEYTFPHDDDTVSFALGVPYTYTQLLQFLQTITDAQKDLKEKAFVTHTNLTYSLGGVIVPLLTITDPDESEFQISKRQYIICTGRVHPGEANSSYMLEGLISEICKDSEEARYLRKRFIFKIVPMLNPDGVIIGNHRSGMCGNDLNRQFLSPNETLHPSVQAMVDLVKEIALDKKDMIFAYIDFHGHSQRKSVFCYGPEFPIHSENYFKARIIPKILSKKTAMFRYRACNYIIPKYKLGTARAVFSMHYGVTNCFTLEASYSSYLNTQRETVAFKPDDYMLMGARVCDSFYEYQKLIEEEEAAEAEKNNKGIVSKKKSEDTLESELEELKSPEIKPQQLLNNVTIVEEQVGSKVDSEGLKTSPREGRRKATTKFRIKKQKGVSADGAGLPREAKSKKNKMKEKEKGGSKIALNNTYVEDSKAIGRGIAKLLSEIKKDNANELLKNKSEDVPADSSGSDNEGPEDDFASDEMRKLQGGILNQINLFQSLCKEKDYEEKFQTLKKKLVIEKPKKANPPVEKEKTEIPQNPKTYRKASMTPPRQYQKTMGGNDWSSQLRQRVPVVPREMLMVFDKQLALSQQKEQAAPLYLNGSPLGTKRKGVRHLINANANANANTNFNTNIPEPVYNSSSTRESPNPKKPMKSKPIIGFPLHGTTAVQGQTFIQYSSRPNPELAVKPKPRAPSITQNRWAGESPEKEVDSTIFDRPFHRAYKLLLGNSKARISTQNDMKTDFEETIEQVYTEGAVPKRDESEFEKAYKMTQFLTGKPIFRRILASRGKALPDNSANSTANFKKDNRFSVLYEVGRKIIRDKRSKKVSDYKLFASNNSTKEDDNR